MTTAEVRQSEWMTKWAMPELLITNAFNWPAKIDMFLCFFEDPLNIPNIVRRAMSPYVCSTNALLCNYGT